MVKFAIVGCGHIGKRHAEMVCRNPESRLIALCDIKPKEDLGIDAYQVPFYKDLDAMLDAHSEIDVLNICVPNALHAPMALKAMEKGCHVVIEKPMALRSENARKVVECSRRTGCKVFCVMQNRYSPPSVWIKSVVDSGILGEIEMVQLDCYWNRDERYYLPGGWHGSAETDGGTLFTQFSHFSA